MFCQFSSLSILYPNLLFILSSLTFLVSVSYDCKPPPHHTVLWIFYSLSFITKCILLEMCLACLMSLIFLAIHTSDLLSNMIIGACYGATYVYLFISSLFINMKCDNAIPSVYIIFYSLSSLDWEMDLEHGCNDIFFHLDKTQYMNLCFYIYLNNPDIWNQITPSISAQT